MTAPQASVIITGAGGAGTIEVLRSLRATGRYRLITADASNWACGYGFADRSYVVPFGADEHFSDAFRDICERERPNFVIPLVDEEIPKVHALVLTLSHRPRIVGPTAAFCELALDKWKTYNPLKAAQLPVATTWLASDAESATSQQSSSHGAAAEAGGRLTDWTGFGVDFLASNVYRGHMLATASEASQSWLGELASAPT